VNARIRRLKQINVPEPPMALIRHLVGGGGVSVVSVVSVVAVDVIIYCICGSL
jgi:hypothetical protein